MNTTYLTLKIFLCIMNTPLISPTLSERSCGYVFKNTYFSKFANPLFQGNFHGSLNIQNTIFKHNIVSSIIINRENINNVFHQNSITHMFQENSNVSIKHSTFINCRSNLISDGGAIMLEWCITNISFTGFINNHAINSGGAINTCLCNKINLSHVGFNLNSAGYSTGAFLCFLSFDVSINDVNSSSDSSPRRSASLSFLSCDTISIQKVIFYNGSSEEGSSLNCDSGYSIINFCRFTSKNTKHAIIGQVIASGKIISSFFHDTSLLNNPIIWESEGIVFIDNCHFRYNRQQVFGFRGSNPINILNNNAFNDNFEIIEPAKIRTIEPPKPTTAPTPSKLMHKVRPTKTQVVSADPKKMLPEKKDKDKENSYPTASLKPKQTKNILPTPTSTLKIPYNPVKKGPRKIININFSYQNMIIGTLIFMIFFLISRLRHKERQPGTAEETFQKFGSKNHGMNGLLDY
ncbi:hypothetical protein TRFO_38289 [Tritrichomonas foetus]|uniref:Right handed beta helix domain-containing protein n=1 Tax=Tritrichomonas foetus TaxID=1144522 RepID=A0A1J4JD54_9EUKA|nr:hypothetical protein TRFO_38289 [Tritrichomonas foetus]|eukprot:OHS95603.1 hypothetical protein TRFO_38289 [Tritrichomonas foetus]